MALREGKGRALVAVMAANNETGVIQPLAEISRLTRGAQALLLVDAVTAAGKIALDASLCDYMTLSGHKLGGPQGSGALVVAKGAPLAPQLLGGGQQKGLRAGTENLSGIAGFGAAAKVVLNDSEEVARIAAVRDHFEAALKQALPDAVIFGGKIAAAVQHLQHRAAGPGVRHHADGAGSGRDSGLQRFILLVGKLAPSHVLSAMGMGEDLAGASLRVSFGWNSVPEDADAVVAALVRLKSRAKSRAA